MFFVYILKSQKDFSYYVGHTEDLKQRIKQHNDGVSKYSSTKRPYKIIWYCCFKEKNKAIAFEKYLKHGSGFAFRNKHLI